MKPVATSDLRQVVRTDAFSQAVVDEGQKAKAMKRMTFTLEDKHARQIMQRARELSNDERQASASEALRSLLDDAPS